MKPSTSHLYLTLKKWQLIAERDRQETDARLAALNAASPAPMCLRRQSALYEAMDDSSAAAGRIAAQFSTAKEQA